MHAAMWTLRTVPDHPPLAGAWERLAARLWASLRSLRSLRRLAAMPGPADHDISRSAASAIPAILGAHASAAPDQPFSDLFLRERMPLTEYLYGMTRDLTARDAERADDVAAGPPRAPPPRAPPHAYSAVANPAPPRYTGRGHRALDGAGARQVDEQDVGGPL